MAAVGSGGCTLWPAQLEDASVKENVLREKLEVARRAGINHLKTDMLQRKTEIVDTMVSLCELEVCSLESLIAV